ncbi:MAG TPA: hypothetical protein VIK55_05015 [Paludibacter sp.]
MKIKSLMCLVSALLISISLTILPVNAQGKKIVGGTTQDYTIIETSIDGNYVLGQPEPSLKAWAGYSIGAIWVDSFTTNYNYVVKSDTLAPNGGNVYTLEYSFTTGISGVVAIGAKDVNVKLGVSASATVKVTNSYSYTCPLTNNGRNVSSCNLIYYPKFTVYKFNEYFLGNKSGTGTAKVVSGFTQLVSIYY